MKRNEIQQVSTDHLQSESHYLQLNSLHLDWHRSAKMTILQQAGIVQKHETINTVKLYVYIKHWLIHMHDHRQ